MRLRITVELLCEKLPHLPCAHNGDIDAVLPLRRGAEQAPAVLVQPGMNQLVGKAHGERSQCEQSHDAEGLPEADMDARHLLMQVAVDDVGDHTADRIRDEHGHVRRDVGVAPDIRIGTDQQASRHDAYRYYEQATPVRPDGVHAAAGFLAGKEQHQQEHQAQPCNVDQCKQKPPPLAAERSEGEPPARGLCLLGFVTVFYIALCHESTPVFPVAREFLSHE